MRKTIIACMLCILFASGIKCFANEERMTTAEKALEKFFYEKRESLRDESGEVDIEDAFLADIDNDRVPELLMSSYIYVNGFSVYKYENGNVYLAEDILAAGRGTGIHEEFNLLMYHDGNMYVYLEGIECIYGPIKNNVFEEAGTQTIQKIYEWPEAESSCNKYLKMNIMDNGTSSLYTDKYSEEDTDWHEKGIELEKDEALAKFDAFRKHTEPFTVWNYGNTESYNGDLYRIWDLQKQKYLSHAEESGGKTVILQIGNNIANIAGIKHKLDADSNVVPIIADGRSLLPVRAVVEAMGGSVEWREKSQTAVLLHNGNEIKLVIGSEKAFFNGEEKMLDVRPELVNGRTMLPIRFIAECFGFKVEWNELTEQIKICDVAALEKDLINKELLECIGKTNAEITAKYGSIYSVEYWEGGKYYRHKNLKTQMFYENANNIYDYENRYDVSDDDRCGHLIVNLSELLKNTEKKIYSIEDLKNVFGECELINDLDNDFYPECRYIFNYNSYEIIVIGDILDPLVESAAVFLQKPNITKIAYNLFLTNEKLGGKEYLLTFGDVDDLLYETLDELKITIDENDKILSTVNRLTKATIYGAQFATGKYPSIKKMITSPIMGDVLAGAVSNGTKEIIFNQLKSCVPDIETLVFGLAQNAYENNVQMLKDQLEIHSRMKNGEFTYDDAVAYIVMCDSMTINRKTMSMAVEVLCDELPQNLGESLLMSGKEAAKAVLSSLFGNWFSGKELGVTQELLTEIITAYTDYACGLSNDFYECMKRINNPAITQWASECEQFNENLAEKINN